ncbi:MAG: hypothetical protein Q8P61_07990 [Candidatus Nanopelagicales bacterium]|nr:hypothetical protein [Candidatus Nanopelagicales bacterium]
MRIAPLAWNFVGDQGTITSSALLFSRGKPAANCHDTDMGKVAEWRGAIHVTAGTNDKSDFTDSVAGALVATLNAGTYNSVVQYCVELARAHNTASGLTAYSFWHEQHPTSSTNRIRAARAGGTVSFQIATGANAADNALRISGGYRDADRSAAAAHVGDFAVVGDYQDIALDFGATRYAADASFLYRPDFSTAAAVTIRGGTAATTGDFEAIAAEHADDTLLYIPYVASTYYRYISLRVLDPQREDRQRASLAYWYHGPTFDTVRSGEVDVDDWEWQSLNLEHVQRCRVTGGISGQPHWSEVAPGLQFSLGFLGQPGLSPNYAAGVNHLLRSLGVEALAFVVLDPDDEPHRSTFLCRVLSAPAPERIATQSRLGRESLSLVFEVVET